MAGEPWNRVSVPFPSAVSCVRVRFRPTTDLIVKTLLGENEKVLKILGSEILQTEIRVLYELLYVLNNSFRGNKTYKGLQQVEQCINRLKSMKLDSALQELTELCPNRIQRGLSLMAGECDVPSQPKLEWLCLKVLGAAQLMSCTLNRCSRAFLLSKRQMKWEEYVILNVVITSMLSRLWVMFRGVLVCLSALYEQLLNFLREVALAQPMPFLTDFSLPADVAELLGPSDAVLLSRPSAHSSQQQRKISSVKVKNQGQRGKVKQDLGTAVERGTVNDADMKPFLSIFRNFTEAKPVPKETRKKPKFKKQVREASTFTDMATHLEEMIQWCKSQKLKKEKRLLTFLLLKCQRMKCVEAAGYNIQRKLETFRQEACWASSPQGSVPRTCRSTASFRRNARRRTCFHKLRNHFKVLALRTLKTHRKTRMTELSVSGLSEDEQSNTSTHTATSQAADCHSHDEIDDIFSSIGL